MKARKRDYFYATVLAYLAPGLGHVYYGQAKLGFGIIGLLIVFQYLFFFEWMNSSALPYLVLLLLIISLLLFDLIGTIVKLKKYGERKSGASNSVIFYFLLLALSTTSSIFRPFETFSIPSGAMSPTVRIGDYITAQRYVSDKIERGDLIVFMYPKDEAIQYIKRVVAMPGETIEVKDKVIYINGSEVALKAIDDFDKEGMVHSRFHDFPLKLYETKTGNIKHFVMLNQENTYSLNYGPKKIPEGHYFVMGDNRDFSSDSRFWGTVPKENVLGKAKAVYFNRSLDKLSQRIGVRLQ